MPTDNFELPNHLSYIADSTPGYTRKRWGRGFSYFSAQGKRVRNSAELNRIKSLVIPPAWEQVWICRDKCGYLQATGYDTKERKQYIYHPDFVNWRQNAKFHKLADFARHLPAIRKQVEKDLSLKGWPKERVVALIVAIMDHTHLRIGNEQYARENESYGLTTLRRKHLKMAKNELRFCFVGKKGVEQDVLIDDKDLRKLIKECSALRGHEVFRYQNGASNTEPVYSTDVNEYLKNISGERFTSKDFRTWGGCVLAIEKGEEARRLHEENTRRPLENILLELVAAELGNTVTVVREYYVHPEVLQTVVNGNEKQFENVPTPRIKHVSLLSRAEIIALNIIERTA